MLPAFKVKRPAKNRNAESEKACLNVCVQRVFWNRIKREIMIICKIQITAPQAVNRYRSKEFFKLLKYDRHVKGVLDTTPRKKLIPDGQLVHYAHAALHRNYASFKDARPNLLNTILDFISAIL